MEPIGTLQEKTVCVIVFDVVRHEIPRIKVGINQLKTQVPGVIILALEIKFLSQMRIIVSRKVLVLIVTPCILRLIQKEIMVGQFYVNFFNWIKIKINLVVYQV